MNLLPRSIAEIPHLRDLDATVEHSFSMLNIDAALVYLVDTVAPSALDYLASQFDIVGDVAYRDAPDVATKRDLIKRSIDTKRKAATVRSIKEAMTDLGYIAPNATLDEGIGSGTTGWAVFAVNMAWGQVQDPIKDAQLTELILQRKNVRSRFLGVLYQNQASDTIPLPLETISVDIVVDNTDTMFVGQNLYDGTHLHDGSINHINGVEAVDYV